MVGSTVLGQGTYYKAERYVKHQQYNKPPFAYDIGLIRVQGSLQFNNNVQPISISNRQVPPGTNVIATGWGRLVVSASNSLFGTKSIEILNKFSERWTSPPKFTNDSTKNYGRQ